MKTRLEQLEQLLYEADFGVQTAMELTHKVRELIAPILPSKQLIIISALHSHLVSLAWNSIQPDLSEVPQIKLPMVILIVGVNGNGKTTSVAKLAHLFKNNQEKSPCRRS